MMKLTNGESAIAMLQKMSNEKLKEGFQRGVRQLAASPDPNRYAGGEYRDMSNMGHPNLEMHESVQGLQHYAKGFANIRIALETAMVDTYQELVRRGERVDVSGIKLIYFPDWKFPKDMTR